MLIGVEQEELRIGALITTWCPSGEWSRPPVESRIYGLLVVGLIHCSRRLIMRLQTCAERNSSATARVILLNIFRIEWGSVIEDPAWTPPTLETYILNDLGFNRRLKFKKDYVHNWHDDGSRHERLGRFGRMVFINVLLRSNHKKLLMTLPCKRMINESDKTNNIRLRFEHPMTKEATTYSFIH